MARTNKASTKKESNKKMSNRKIALIFFVVLLCVAVITVAAVFIYKYVSREKIPPTPDSPALDSEPPYADGTDVFEKSKYEIKQAAHDDKEKFVESIRNRDEQIGSYRLIIREENSDKSFELNYWDEMGKEIYEFIFKGYDMDTGLDGVYYRTVIDDIPTLVNYQTGEFHTSGEFFDKYHKVLSDITLDLLLSDIYKEEFLDIGINSNGDTVISSGDVSICVSNNELCETRVLDKRAGTTLGYYIAYGHPYSFPIIEPKN